MEKVNQWNCSEFVQKFGSVVEHCPLAAATVWAERPFQDIGHLNQCFADFLYNLSPKAQKGVLRLHPELGTRRTSREEKLTAHSEQEQKRVGLLQLADAESLLIRELNIKYREMTGFPFVVFVADLEGPAAVVTEMQRRLSILAASSPASPTAVDEECEKGVQAVAKIAASRINQIVTSL